jgi:hypothetical protein
LRTESEALQTEFMQIQELILTNPEAAQALRDNDLLPEFLEPTSPSAVAKKTGLAANVVHHHARRFLELGLLFEASRKAGRVFYQLTARCFKYDHNLLGETPEDTELTELKTAFVRAYQRSSSLVGREIDYSSHLFADRSKPTSSHADSQSRKPCSYRKSRGSPRPLWFSDFSPQCQKIPGTRQENDHADRRMRR